MINDWPGCIPSLSDQQLRTILSEHPRGHDKFGRSGLFYAVYMQNIWLLSKLAPVEARTQDVNGMTALMFAASSGFLEGVKVLAPLEALVVDHNRNTALLYAILHGNYQAADVIFKSQQTLTAAISCTSCTSSLLTLEKPYYVDVQLTGQKTIVLSTSSSLQIEQHKRPSSKDFEVWQDLTSSGPGFSSNSSSISLLQDKEEGEREPIPNSLSAQVPIELNSSSSFDWSASNQSSDQDDFLLEPRIRQDVSTISVDEPSMLLNTEVQKPPYLEISSMRSSIGPSTPLNHTVFRPIQGVILPAKSLLDSSILSTAFYPSLLITPLWKLACQAPDFYVLHSSELTHLSNFQRSLPTFIPITALMAGYHIYRANLAIRLHSLDSWDMYASVREYLQTHAKEFAGLVPTDATASLTFAIFSMSLGSRTKCISDLSASNINSMIPCSFPGMMYHMNPTSVIPKTSLSSLILLVHEVLFPTELFYVSENTRLQYAKTMLLGCFPETAEDQTSSPESILRCVLDICPPFPECNMIALAVVRLYSKHKCYDIGCISLLIAICACFRRHRLLWNLSLQYLYRTIVKFRDMSIPILDLIKQCEKWSKARVPDLFSLLFPSSRIKTNMLSRLSLHMPQQNLCESMCQSQRKDQAREKQPQASDTTVSYYDLIGTLVDIADTDEAVSALQSAIVFRNQSLRDVILQKKGTGKPLLDSDQRTAYAIEALASRVPMSVHITVNSEGELHAEETLLNSFISSQGIIVPIKEVATLVLAARITSFHCLILLKAAIHKLPLRVIHFFELFSSLDTIAFQRLFVEHKENYTPIPFEDADCRLLDIYGNSALEYSLIQSDRMLELDRTFIPTLKKMFTQTTSNNKGSDSQGVTLLMRLSLVNNTLLYSKLLTVMQVNNACSQTIFGETALMTAAKTGNVVAAVNLLSKGEGGMQTALGMTALMFAMRQTPISEDIVGMLLLKEGGMQDSYGNTALMHLCLISGCGVSSRLSGFILQELFAKEGTLSNKYGMTPLMFSFLGSVIKKRLAYSHLFCFHDKLCSVLEDKHIFTQCINSLELGLQDEDEMSVDSDSSNESHSSENRTTFEPHSQTDRAQGQESPTTNFIVERNTRADTSSQTDETVQESQSSSDELHIITQQLKLSNDASTAPTLLESEQFYGYAIALLRELRDSSNFQARSVTDQELVASLVGLVGKDGYTAISMCFGMEMFGHTTFSDRHSYVLHFPLAIALVKLRPLSLDHQMFNNQAYQVDMYGNTTLDYCLGDEGLTSMFLSAALSAPYSPHQLVLTKTILCQFMTKLYNSIDTLCTEEHEFSWRNGLQKNFCYNLFELFFSQFDISDESTHNSAFLSTRQHKISKLCRAYVSSRYTINKKDQFAEKCVICMIQPKEICIYDCGHLVYCRSCSKKQELETALCPLCRKRTRMLIAPIFLSRTQTTNEVEQAKSELARRWGAYLGIYSISSD